MCLHTGDNGVAFGNHAELDDCNDCHKKNDEQSEEASAFVVDLAFSFGSPEALVVVKIDAF